MRHSSLNTSRMRVAIGIAVAASLASVPFAAHAQSAPLRVRPGRLVGVYDELSGAPLDDVTVTDIGNGLSTRTTPVGTLTLFFVDTIGGLLRFQKIGYAPLLLPLANSDRDSTPVTILMRRAATQLSPMVTRAHSYLGPADTVRFLEEHGFYERRVSTAAPSYAFLTEDKIANLTTLADASRLTGRPFCGTNLYINGIRVRGDWIRGLEPKYVRAIEMYRSEVEAPVEFGGDKRSRDCGATVIWTK